MKKIILFALVLACFLLPARDAYPFEMWLENGKLTLHADKIPLQNILEHFSDMGINVRVDPEINPKLSASFGCLNRSPI